MVKFEVHSASLISNNVMCTDLFAVSTNPE